MKTKDKMESAERLAIKIDAATLDAVNNATSTIMAAWLAYCAKMYELTNSTDYKISASNMKQLTDEVQSRLKTF